MSKHRSCALSQPAHNTHRASRRGNTPSFEPHVATRWGRENSRRIHRSLKQRRGAQGSEEPRHLPPHPTETSTGTGRRQARP
eukprot:11218110-Lingulodinium_polyedra.AAC.1